MSFNASFQDLKNIFNNNICVRDIAESLISFDSEKPAKTVKKFMIEKEFTVVGLRRNGEIKGYVKKDNLLDDGTIDSFSKNIDYEISEKAGMMEALNKLKENDYYFVKLDPITLKMKLLAYSQKTELNSQKIYSMKGKEKIMQLIL